MFHVSFNGIMPSNDNLNVSRALLRRSESKLLDVLRNIPKDYLVCVCHSVTQAWKGFLKF
jgi:hypothetical protein